MTYGNMHTMKTSKGDIVAEILWNGSKQCYAIRNYLTLKITDYKSQQDMRKAWTKIKETAKKKFGVEIHEF